MGRWGLRISTASSALPLTRQSPAIGESPNITRCHLVSFLPPVRIIEDANKRAIRGHATLRPVWVVRTVAMSPHIRGRAMAAPRTPNIPFRRIATAIALHRYHSRPFSPDTGLFRGLCVSDIPPCPRRLVRRRLRPTESCLHDPKRFRCVKTRLTAPLQRLKYSGMQSGCKKHHRAEASFRLRFDNQQHCSRLRSYGDCVCTSP